MGEDEPATTGSEDDTWPYDPGWVELAELPLERLRREAFDPASGEPTRYPAPAQPRATR
jgi:hypothetical protein